MVIKSIGDNITAGADFDMNRLLCLLNQNMVKEIRTDQLKEALSHGDTVDNSEYEDAKNNQAFVEGRIITIEKMLDKARPLEFNRGNGQQAVLGSTVKLKNIYTDKTCVYTLVSTAESNPFENKISDESPVGKAVLSSTAGEQVKVKAPAGIFYYKIEDIQ